MNQEQLLVRNRNMYILFSVIFVFICGMLISYNPGEIFNGGTVTSIIIFSMIGIAVILTAFIVITSYYLNSPGASKNTSIPFAFSTALTFLGASLGTIVLILISYGIISYNLHLFLALIIITVLGGIIWGRIKLNKEKGNEWITTGYRYLIDNKMGIAYVTGAAILLGGYIAWEYGGHHAFKGGTTVTDTNRYIPLNKETVVSTNTILNNGEEINYRYGFSFWVYIDSAAKNIQTQKTFNIVNYGSAGNPHIVYDTNSLKVLIYDEKNDSITVYDDTNFPLQRWNQIAINYDGGQLDVFINGELRASQSGDVPYLKYNNLVVGDTDGLIGDVKNIIYFKDPISIAEIRAIYASQ